MLGHMQSVSQMMSAKHPGAGVAQVCLHLKCSKGLALDNKDRASVQRRTMHGIPRTATSRILVDFGP